MKIAYFDCFSGISGDMIIGAFLDHGVPMDMLKDEINRLNLKDVNLNSEKVNKKGLSATKFKVEFPSEDVHRGLHDINDLIGNSGLSDSVKIKSINIFTRLAEAEGKIHNKSVDEIHFHEVGAIDAIVDIVGSVICLEFLKIDKVLASKISVGSGKVKCAHGVIPVPAPATIELLSGVPIHDSGIHTEIVTPTGAAIITSLATGYGSIPGMTIKKTGYGAGDKDLPQSNVLRLIIGEDNSKTEGLILEEIFIIQTNIDDMNPQYYDHVIDLLFVSGALDAYLTPVIMKKGRPGMLLTVSCYEGKLQTLTEIIMKESTSIGVRYRKTERLKAPRRIEKVQTKYGVVRFKIAEFDGIIVSSEPEYEDCKSLAQKLNLPLHEIYKEICLSGKVN